MESVSREVEAKGEVLARASVEGMYADPFWEARYGARARRFGGEDALHHVRYLVQALATGRPAVMADYARWLRTLLIARGMCSLHLDENFAGLARALEAQGFAPGGPAHACVQAARDALRYTEGAAGALQAASEALARQVAGQLVAESLGRERVEMELRLQLSYLADALGAGRPELFAEHCRWYAGFWPRREFGGLAFSRVLGALEEALLGHDEARALVSAARAQRESRP
jgi:hypothetical protein